MPPFHFPATPGVSNPQQKLQVIFHLPKKTPRTGIGNQARFLLDGQKVQ